METEVVEYDQYERRRFWRRSILRLVFVVLLIFGSHALWSFVSGRAALQDAIEETEAIDPRWRIDDLLADRAEVPDKENAALVIIRGHNLIDWPKNHRPRSSMSYRKESTSTITDSTSFTSWRWPLRLHHSKRLSPSIV